MAPRAHATETPLVTLSAPTWRVPVVARSGTSDLAAFRHVSYDLELVVPPELIVDLGANVGYASVAFASRYPDARVLAVEPEPGNVEVLRRNVAPLPRVDVVEAAVWPHSGRLTLDDPGKGHWGYRVRKGDAEDSAIRAVTVAELLIRADADAIDLLKIDIEGSELELFSADTEWLERVEVLAIELHDRFRPGCREALDAALARTGATYREESRGELTVFARVDGVAR